MELRPQLRDLVTNAADPLAHVGRTQRIHRTTIVLAVSDERADADNRVVDVLRRRR
jgi:hypothetical protein